MPTIENLLVGNTAIKTDTARRPAPVPFGPILVSEIAARLSDVAPPREANPDVANNDRRPDRLDDDRGRDRATRRNDDKIQDLPADDRAARPRPDDPPPVASAAPANDRYSNAASEPSDVTKVDEPASPPTTDGADAPVANSGQTENSDSAETTETATTTETGSADGNPAAPARVDETGIDQPVAPDPIAAAVALRAQTPKLAEANAPSSRPGVLPIPAATGVATPVTAPTITPSSPAAATPATPSNASPNAGDGGKIQLAGLKPTNDDSPVKIGSDVPRIVRDARSILARPANAAGGNLVQAQHATQDQGGEPSAAPRIASAPPSNAAPLSQAGQPTSLHVGATPGQNSADAGAQTSGQQNGGQQNGGRNANNGAASGSAQAAIMPPDAATQLARASQDFQQTLNQSPGNGSARAPALGSGESATSGRVDAASAPLGGPQSTFSADPAARAASTAPADRPAPSAAADQVSVRLSKAVENGDSRIRIQLRPQELGRVEVKLDIGADGRAKALILAERPETLELLQRDSRVLERALQDAGLKTDQGSLAFDLQGREGEDRTQHAGREAGAGSGRSGDEENTADDGSGEQPIPATAIGLAPDGSVNFLA